MGKKTNNRFLNRRFALKKTRVQLEKLEDRVLLSADPLLQLKTASDQPLTTENVPLDLLQVQAGDKSFNLNDLIVSKKATVIDLTKGASQNSALTSENADLMRLSKQLKSLVLDLGANADNVTLTQTDDGMLRVSGDSIIDLLFAAPTELIGLRGDSGVDKVLVENVNLTTADLVIEAESIQLGEGFTLQTQGNAVFEGYSSVSSKGDAGVSLDVDASVGLYGSARIGGQLILDAQVSADLQVRHNAVDGSVDLDLTSSAVAEIGQFANITANNVKLLASTSNDLVVNSQGGIGTVSMEVTQNTRASVTPGATFNLAAAGTTPDMALLIEAVDRSRISSKLDTDDSLVTDFTKGLDLGIGTLNLERNALALLGDNTATSPQTTTVNAGEDDTHLAIKTGRIQVSAAIADDQSGGVTGAVSSSLVGVQTITLKDKALSLVDHANLASASLQLYALNEASHDASAKIAKQSSTGSVAALLSDSTVQASGEVQLVAKDQASFTTTSGEFVADSALLSGVQLSVLSAVNSIDRTVQAITSDSTLYTGAVSVIAVSQAELSVETKAMAVKASTSDSPPSLRLGGTLAWNQLNGGTTASVVDSTLSVVGGDVTVGARNASTVSSLNTAGSPTSSAAGSAAGISLAFNAIGWKMADPVSASLDSLLGTDLGFTGGAYEILADVSGSKVSTDRNPSVSADDAMDISSTITNKMTAVAVSSTGLSVGAAAVLASNRVRTETRAYVKGRAKAIAGSDVTVGDALDPEATGSGADPTASTADFSLQGSLTVTASDDAKIDSEVTIVSSSSSQSGSSVAVGVLVARNDVRNQVEAYLVDVELDAAGNAGVSADSTTLIAANLSGKVTAKSKPSDTGSGSDTGAGSGTSSAGSSVAVNGLIASNLILSNTRSWVTDSDITTGGDFTVKADESAAIQATNSATTSSSGAAVGVTLAFNTIGWQAQNLLYAAVDALLGTSIGDEEPVTASALVTGGSFDVGGSMTVTASDASQIDASIVNKTSSTAASAGAGFVLASNMVSAKVNAMVQPDAGAAARLVLSTGSGLSVLAEDAASIDADASMSSGSGGGVAVGGLVVRNDVRSQVVSLLNQAQLSSGGDVQVLARTEASIEACLEGETTSGPAKKGSTGLGLAVNALIANNLVLSKATATLSDSDLFIEGNLQVDGDDVSTITADNSATMSSGGTAVGVVLAFNTIGWQAQNILFSSLDALLGTDIGTEQPAEVSARLVNTTFTVTGDVEVLAGGLDKEPGAQTGALIEATVSNSAESSGSSAAVSFILGQNKVSSRSLAWISPVESDPVTAAGLTAANEPQRLALLVGGNLTVTATDAAQIDSTVSLEATSGGGTAVGGVASRNDARSSVQSGLDRVNLDIGGDVVVTALESAHINATVSGQTVSLSEEEDATAEAPVEGASRKSAAGTSTDTSTDTGSQAATGPGAVSATDSTPTPAAESATASQAETTEASTATPIAVNGLIANNLVLSAGRATVTNSAIVAGGGLTVEVDNESGIEAENTATMESGGTAVGVTLAFNSIGWQATNLLKSTIGALVGSNLGTAQPAEALAKVYNTTLNLGGDLTVHAALTATLKATTSNETTAAGGSSAASVVLASNAVNTAADALVRFPDGTADQDRVINVAGDLHVSSEDAPNIDSGTTVSAIASTPEEGDGEYFKVDLRSGDGLQEVHFGDQVLVADDHEAGGEGGRIYRYMGGKTVDLDLSETDYTDTGYWYELLPLPPSLSMVNKFMGLLGTEMPYVEKEFNLVTIPVGSQSFDIGLKVMAGWKDLTVLDFLKGEAEPSEGGLEVLPTGIKLSLPALTPEMLPVLGLIPLAGDNFESPALTIELELPDPKLPDYEYEKVLGKVTYSGQDYEWGVKADFGWSNKTLLDIVNLQDLLNGKGFSPVLPEMVTNVFLRPVQVESTSGPACGSASKGGEATVPIIDTADFMPSQFTFQAPTATFNFLGKAVELKFGSVTMDTPASFDRYVDSSLKPKVIKLDGFLPIRLLANYPDG
ncbi:MAG: LEPR-XLL domain-containing protein [Magnetococcales bacterium]|nr:LEPR-XLL domain-containing protein [Magnetococcales bacterium]